MIDVEEMYAKKTKMYIDKEGYLKKPMPYSISLDKAKEITVLNIKIKGIAQLKHDSVFLKNQEPICYCIFAEIDNRDIEIYLNSNRVRVYNYIFRKFDEKGISINMNVLDAYSRRSRRDFIDELIDVIVEKSQKYFVNIPNSCYEEGSNTFFSKNEIYWDDVKQMMK